MTQKLINYNHQLLSVKRFAGIAGTTNIASASQYVGGQFYAAKTATIDKICYLVTAVSSPSMEIEAAITSLDANGYPKGGDVAVSSTTTTSFSANTAYELTISASVTRGTLYGVVVRPKSYTSGTITLQYSGQALFGGDLAYKRDFPCVVYNSGADAKANADSPLGVRYGATDGYLPTIGLGGNPMSTTYSLATSGDVFGNKFTVDFPFTVVGYVAQADVDYDVDVAMFSGTDNTAITGSTVTLYTAYRANNASNHYQVMLATPLSLPAGTYRVGFKATSSNANNVSYFQYTTTERIKQILGYQVQKTLYSSGAWTDTDAQYVFVTPLISMDDGSPSPNFSLGI